jgi:hypothetical protein
MTQKAFDELERLQKLREQRAARVTLPSTYGADSRWADTESEQWRRAHGGEGW